MCLARPLWCMFLNCTKPFCENIYGYVSVVNEVKIINLVLLASKKFEKKLVAV